MKTFDSWCCRRWNHTRGWWQVERSKLDQPHKQMGAKSEPSVRFVDLWGNSFPGQQQCKETELKIWFFPELEYGNNLQPIIDISQSRWWTPRCVYPLIKADSKGNNVAYLSARKLFRPITRPRTAIVGRGTLCLHFFCITKRLDNVCWRSFPPVLQDDWILATRYHLPTHILLTSTWTQKKVRICSTWTSLLIFIFHCSCSWMDVVKLGML